MATARTSWWVALAVVLLAPAAPAQGPRTRTSPRADTALATRGGTSPVVVGRDTVAMFRAPLGARTAAERAADAVARIEALVEADVADGSGTRRIPEGILVTVGERGVFTITPADLDTLLGETLEQAGARAASRLGAALRSAREEQSLPHLLRGAALGALATVFFLVALRLLRAARRLLLVRLPAAAGTRLRGVSVAGFMLFSTEHLLRFTRRTADLAAWAAGLFIAYLWLAYVLTRFAYTRSWGEALGAYLTTTISQLALGALAAIPGLFTVVLIVVATRWLGRIVGAFFDAVEGGNVSVPWVHAETANPTKRLAVALLWVFAIVVAYPYLPGSGSDVFKGVSVFVGLVISLGSSGVVNQAMSGLVLMYSRALKPGDYVRVADTEGVVTELGLLSTKIRTNKREVVTIPNGVVVGTTTKNYSRLVADDDGGVILYTSITIGYDTPWRQVHALLLAAAERTLGLRRDPAPFVRQVGLSDFYVEYQLNAHLERPEERIAVLSTLHEHIQDCFNEHGVQIMSPHYEGDPATPKVVPPDRWPARPVDGVRVGDGGAALRAAPGPLAARAARGYPESDALADHAQPSVADGEAEEREAALRPGAEGERHPRRRGGRADDVERDRRSEP